MKQYLDPLQQEAHDAFFIIGRDGPEEVFPPNVQKADFIKALAQLREICGPENVVAGKDLVNFVDPFAVNVSHIPSAAVCPANVEEIQQILEVFNTHKIPAWTCSRGKNLGYGGPAPLVKGSIVLSLHRMCSIIEVNESGAYAIVEPGVSFRDLSEYCLANKPSVWPNVPSIGWGSVIGNALDKGIGYNQLGDHWHNISGLEVVLANGDIVRTGQWAADGAPTAHLCKNSFGPQIDGLFLQSNLGIVTKMSLWLQPRPQTYMSVKVEVDKFSDIAPLVDALGLLHREDILQSNPLIGDVLGYLSIQHSAEQLYEGSGAIPDDIISQLQQKHGLGAWTAIFDFYGTKAMVQARLERCQSVMLAACPGACISHRFTEVPEGEFLDARKIAEVGRGEPAGVVGTSRSRMINFALPADGSGHGAHTDYVPLMPNDGQFILKWFIEARKIMVAHGFNAILGGRVFKKHSFTIQMMFYDSSSAAHRKNLHVMWRALGKAGEKYHLTNYRSHLDHMGMSDVSPQYGAAAAVSSILYETSVTCSPFANVATDYCQKAFDFNDHAYRRFVETLKDKLDPNGILSPGKQGIWPEAWKRFRSEQPAENGDSEVRNEGT
ncbi:hypothetical protein LTR20_002883 [Exophiala xenobiotica]|nr:hypothetical protein LTS13_000476 [Exophiala xenobiotica]KAK5403613.1 hypothetical protein LTR79_000366 [Exophiala xenobiotica]KAK5414692.1 hypothetical protein LTR06_004507 [Exophiala xenobiotica]KAK5423102.1 hypothetical protein LTR90_002120 [Exophiala xenobiotica]KAK5468537.1 hypothetical protein LTR20_002883 [Exophiala xenobiotica]